MGRPNTELSVPDGKKNGIGIVKSMTKGIKSGSFGSIVTILLAFFCVPAVGFLIFAINFNNASRDIGGAMGSGAGTAAGLAIGSMEGLTVGQLEGHEAGKQKGLSAEDTTAELATKIQEVSRLEVLVASGTYSDVMKIGDDYAALLTLKYNAVFTIDLDNADIQLKNDGLHILLDQPVVEFFPVSEPEKRAEYQKGSFVIQTGSAEEGFDALNNSADKIKEEATQSLQNNEGLMKSARTAGIDQLIQLVNAVSLSKPQVIVEYRGGENE